MPSYCPRLPRAPYAALQPSLNKIITLTAYHYHRATTVLYRPRGHHQSRAILARTRCRLSEIKTEISWDLSKVKLKVHLD